MTARPTDPDLLAIVEENSWLLEGLRNPAPSEETLERLRAIARTAPVRVEAEATLALLLPGSLAPPPFTDEFRARLSAIPRRSPAARVELAPPRASRVPALLLDWRVSVALAYAAALLVVALLGVDPLSAARKAAFDLASTGQQAIDEARESAQKRISGSGLGAGREALTRQLDYKLYRTLEVSKATAAAWGSLMIEKVFGQTEEQPARAGGHEVQGTSPRTGLPEPEGPDFRS